MLWPTAFKKSTTVMVPLATFMHSLAILLWCTTVPFRSRLATDCPRVSVHICFNHGLVLLQAWDHWPQWGVAVTDQVFEAIIPRLTWEGICSGWNFSVFESLVNLFILTGVRVCTCIMKVTYIRLYQMIHKINSSGFVMFIVCTIINKQNHIHIQCSIKF